ncbi:threo-3-hydroxy-L-aspartate ammonia-lyase [Kocuria soli]|uniref:threonine ammonia-lyase n=1 Tax=Kocuria soli TaxID=2485125 RepID=A0A3N3ZV96_9MICC|nr:threo-3-hydroxy-L-aspartate ammonia-lyase [Kocuria soli]
MDAPSGSGARVLRHRIVGSDRLAGSFIDVDGAAARLRRIAHRTPVMTSTRLNEWAGAEVFFKCENFQRAGAFKFRGAYNAVTRAKEAGARGVVAFSSGNHAQAVALAGRLNHVPTTIVMPTDAPAVKRAATEGYGARVVEYDRYTQNRTSVAEDIAREQDAALIPPFDHPDVVAGQATVGRELCEEIPDLDVIVTPLGGGGLTSGVALAAHAHDPNIQIIGVEPEAGDDARRSLEQGRIVSIEVPRTIADGAQTVALAPLTFGILQRENVQVSTASDEQLVEAMRAMAQSMKVIVEPTAALGLAWVLNSEELAGRRVGVVLSGGNVDLRRFAELIG